MSRAKHRCAGNDRSVTRTSSLADRLALARERMRSVYGLLSDDAVTRTPNPIMSPPVWDLGHIAAYEELWSDAESHMTG